QGKVSGFVGSELMLVKLQHQAASSAVPVKILEPALFIEPWGVGVRKGDTAMLNQVNKVLDGMEASGQAAKTFDKWFGPGTQFNIKRDFRIEEIKG
ncbi:MAG: transporter substrate-binding domain-containing protein, partial [Achromobacter mucicolens]